MRLRIALVTVLGLLAFRRIDAQITANPFPAPVEKRGLAVEIKRCRPTAGNAGHAAGRSGRQSVRLGADQLRARSPDGRRFVNDSRGFLYLMDSSNKMTCMVNIGEMFPMANYNRLESGFIAFAFHPDFARNGLFYTVHSERAPGNPAKPDFVPPGFTAADATWHNVITEWHATNPAANTFRGTRRELLRVAHMVQNLTHPFGDVEFNPTAKPGSEDYGLLYTSGSDLGFSNGGGGIAPTIRVRRSGSSPSSARSFASIRAARRCRKA